jgi:hypothetical protein
MMRVLMSGSHPAFLHAVFSKKKIVIIGAYATDEPGLGRRNGCGA